MNNLTTEKKAAGINPGEEKVAKAAAPNAVGSSQPEKEASTWLKENGRTADRTQRVPHFLCGAAIERIANYAHNKINRRKDLRWAGAIAILMLAASAVVWYQNRLNWEMTHSSWPAHARRMMFQTEIE